MLGLIGRLIFLIDPEWYEKKFCFMFRCKYDEISTRSNKIESYFFCLNGSYQYNVSIKYKLLRMECLNSLT